MDVRRRDPGRQGADSTRSPNTSRGNGMAPTFPEISTRPRIFEVVSGAGRDRTKSESCRLSRRQRDRCDVAGTGNRKEGLGRGC